MAIADSAASTITRQRELHDEMERFIGNRRRAFIPRSRELAAELGLAEATLPFLAHLRQIAEGDLVPLERLRRRLCYAAKEGWRSKLAELEGVGLVTQEKDGWRVTDRGMAAIERVWSEIHQQLRALPLPVEPLRRAVEALEAIVAPATGDQYDRLTMIRRTSVPDRAHAEAAVRIEQAMFETCVLLDDGHIHAWRRAGYRGPVLDVLTKVWNGAGTRDALYKALSYSQESTHVDDHIGELVARGDVRVDGDLVALTEQGRATRDRIEEETNRDGLARWPTGDALERLMTDIEALVAVLPPEDELPKGPTH